VIRRWLKHRHRVSDNPDLSETSHGMQVQLIFEYWGGAWCDQNMEPHIWNGALAFIHACMGSWLIELSALQKHRAHARVCPTRHPSPASSLVSADSASHPSPVPRGWLCQMYKNTGSGRFQHSDILTCRPITHPSSRYRPKWRVGVGARVTINVVLRCASVCDPQTSKSDARGTDEPRVYTRHCIAMKTAT
jgi:hypothetical protein